MILRSLHPKIGSRFVVLHCAIPSYGSNIVCVLTLSQVVVFSLSTATPLNCVFVLGHASKLSSVHNANLRCLYGPNCWQYVSAKFDWFETAGRSDWCSVCLVVCVFQWHCQKEGLIIPNSSGIDNLLSFRNCDHLHRRSRRLAKF